MISAISAPVPAVPPPAKPATPDYAAIMRAPPDARTQRALDTLASVLRDMRAAADAYWTGWRGAQGGTGNLQTRDLPPAEFAAAMRSALDKARADGELGAPASERDVSDKTGREYRETRWNDPATGRLKAVLFAPKDGTASGTTLVVPDAARTGNATIWFADRKIVPWDLAAKAIQDIAQGAPGLTA